MKKKQITFDKKLSLDKLILAKLNNEQALVLDGGKTGWTITCRGAVEGLDNDDQECIACSNGN